MEWLYQINEAQWEQVINSSFSTIKQTTLHIVSAEMIWLDYWTKVPGYHLLIWLLTIG